MQVPAESVPSSRRRLLLLPAALWVTGCAALASSAVGGFADNLNSAILEQSDPETVRDGAPAYLLLMDSLVQGNPGDPELLASAALLYAAYGVLFAEENERARRLTSRARQHGARALCAQNSNGCELQALPYDDFLTRLEAMRTPDAEALYASAVSWLAYIRTHDDDWLALAELPKVEAGLERLRALDPSYETVNVHLYLGILNTLRPEALGGRPAIGRGHFERALALSGGRDLGVKVEYARSYARLVYDRELHDRLLNEVLQADAEAPGLTLLNTVAQREARNLLASAEDYF